MKRIKIRPPYALRLTAAAVAFIAVCLTFTGKTDLSFFVKAQLFPALDRHAFGIVAALLLFTVLFGRFYCSVLCPFGLLQDTIAFLSRRKSKPDANRRRLRYAVAAFAFTVFAAGSAAVFAVLDPYSNFGRIAAFAKTKTFGTGAVALLLITALTVWKKRIFCTSVCPIGTLLGLCAKFSPFKLGLSDKCVKCRRCVAACPSGCIAPENKALDNERCVRCLKCVNDCPVCAIGFTARKEAASEQATDTSRRTFLTSAATTAAAVGAGVAFAGHLKKKEHADEYPICPPGNQGYDDFVEKCTNCQLCVSVCSGKVLRPKTARTEAVHLEYGDRFCRYDCHKCSSVCPTGALLPMTLTEKQRRRIGFAAFDHDKCIGCGLCSMKCPTGAVRLGTIDGEDKAVLSRAYCIGCGACVSACPLPEKAVRVVAVTAPSTAEPPCDD